MESKTLARLGEEEPLKAVGESILRTENARKLESLNEPLIRPIRPPSPSGRKTNIKSIWSVA